MIPTRVRLAATAVLVIVFAWALAVAGEQEDAAEALNKEGRALHEKRDVAGAAAKFRAAWDLVPEARYAYNLGRALNDAGRLAEAADFFAIYLAHAGADPAVTPWVQKKLAELEVKLAKVRVRTDQEDARLWVNGVSRGAGGADFTVRLDPGTHLVEVEAGGRRVEDKLKVSAGEIRELDLRARLAPPPAAPPDAGPVEPVAQAPDAGVLVEPPPPETRVVVTPWWHDKLGLGLAAAGLVAGGVSGFFYWRSTAQLADADAATFAPDHDAALEDARASRKLAQWTAGGAAVLLVGAALRFVVKGDTRREVPGVRVDAHQGGLVLGWEGTW